MKNQFAVWFMRGCWLLALAVVAISCSDPFGSDSKSNVNANLSAKSNAQMVMASQEVLDITGSGMSSQGINYGRAAAHGGDGEDDEKNLCGAIITKNFSLNTTLKDSLILSGTITIDFGDGSNCSDSSEHRRSGKITTEFTINVNLKNHTYKSVETVTLNDFTKGSRKLSGVFKARAASGGMQWLDVTNASLTYNPNHNGDDDEEDGDDNEPDSVATITWNGSLTFTQDNHGTLNRGDDTKTVTGSITGTVNGGTFSSEITGPVTFKWACFHGRNIPVSGTVNITSAGVSTVLDFGDGRCDKVYTSASGGTTTELHF